MGTALGRTATRIHFLLVLVVAVTGVGMLVAVVGTMLLADDPYSRDMGLLGLMLTAPLWLVGLVAGADAFRVIRGGRVGRLRALIWALVVLVGGVLVAGTSGSAQALLTLLREPGRVHLDWPVLAVPFGDGGAQYFYLDGALFWAPFVAMVLGATSLIAVAVDRLRSVPADGSGPVHGSGRLG